MVADQIKSFFLHFFHPLVFFRKRHPMHCIPFTWSRSAFVSVLSHSISFYFRSNYIALMHWVRVGFVFVRQQFKALTRWENCVILFRLLFDWRERTSIQKKIKKKKQKSLVYTALRPPPIRVSTFHIRIRDPISDYFCLICGGIRGWVVKN